MKINQLYSRMVSTVLRRIRVYVGGLRVVGKLATSGFYKEAIHIPWDQISRDVHVQKVKACQLICDFIKFYSSNNGGRAIQSSEFFFSRIVRFSFNSLSLYFTES